MTITIQIGEMPDKVRQWASHGSYRVVKTKADAALALARKLVAAGYDPDEPLEVSRGEMVCLRYRTLGVAAGLVIEEDDKGRFYPRFRKYRPAPLGGYVSGREKTGVEDAE